MSYIAAGTMARGRWVRLGAARQCLWSRKPTMTRPWVRQASRWVQTQNDDFIRFGAKQKKCKCPWPPLCIWQCLACFNACGAAMRTRVCMLYCMVQPASLSFVGSTAYCAPEAHTAYLLLFECPLLLLLSACPPGRSVAACSSPSCLPSCPAACPWSSCWAPSARRSSTWHRCRTS